MTVFSSAVTRIGTKPILLANIEVPTRLRQVDPAWVDALAQSIEKDGQHTPIEVALIKSSKNEMRDKYRLIAGAHRYNACKKLDAQGEVYANIVECISELEEEVYRLREIDENLFRHELTPLDRAIFLHERKSIYEKLNPDTKAGVAGGKVTKDILSFVGDTAEKINLGEKTIQRACRIGERLSEDSKKRISGTWLAHKAGELLKLSAYGPELQASVVSLLLDEDSSVNSVSSAEKYLAGNKGKDEDTTTADDHDYKKLVMTYQKAPAAAKRRYIAWLASVGELQNLDLIVKEFEAETVIKEAAE